MESMILKVATNLLRLSLVDIHSNLLIDYGFDSLLPMVYKCLITNYYISMIMSDLEESDDFVAFWRYLE